MNNTFEPLETLDCTTKTYVINLKGFIDLETVYELLPITPIKLKNTRKNIKNVKIPHYPGKQGSIYHIKYKKNTRGIVKSVSEKYFKNAVLLDMGLVDKNIAVKISEASFQLTGVKCDDNLKECVDHLMKYFYTIQETLDYMKDNPEAVALVDNWVLKNLKGPNNTLNPIPDIIENIDLKILNFLTSYLFEFTTFEDYYTVFQWIIKGQTLVKDLEVVNNTLILTNYNYWLGFGIDRDKTAEYLKNETDFTVIYDNSEAYYIKIEYAYVRDETFDKIRKKPGTPKHTILIYKSGRVTQSGPGFSLMKDCYDKFRTEMLRLRPFIERKFPMTTNGNPQMIRSINEIKEQHPTEFLDFGNLIVM